MRLPNNAFPATGGTGQPQFISQDWPGVPRQVDAAMAGRIYISGSASRSSWVKKPKSARRNRKRYRSRSGRGRSRSRSRSQSPRRQSRSAWLSWFSSEESGVGAYNYDYNYEMDLFMPATCEPIQSVYFFSGGWSPCHPCSWFGQGLPCCPWSPWAECSPWVVTPEGQSGSS